MAADLINGLFELTGAGFILFGHCRRLLKDKLVRGVSWAPTAFFFGWGLWNLYYYPALAQWWSFAGGLAIVIANCIWLGLTVYYIRAEKARLLSPYPPRPRRALAAAVRGRV